MRIIEKQNSRLIGEFPVVAIAATAPRAGSQHSVIFQCQHAGIAHIEKKLVETLKTLVKADELVDFPFDVAGAPTTTKLRTIGVNDIDLAAALAPLAKEILASKAQFKLTLQVSLKFSGDTYVNDKGESKTFADNGVVVSIVEVQPLTEVDEIRILRASATLLAMQLPTEVAGRAKRDTAPVQLAPPDDGNENTENVDEEIAKAEAKKAAELEAAAATKATKATTAAPKS